MLSYAGWCWLEAPYFPQSECPMTTIHSLHRRMGSSHWQSRLERNSTQGMGIRSLGLELNYERFNRNNFNIRSWSWNYRGCWHQTCPPIANRRQALHPLIPLTGHKCPVKLLLVTTSLCQDWVIRVPAAFLRCGSHFSSSLSGIEP